MPAKKTKYSKTWEHDRTWLTVGKEDEYRALCGVCRSVINVSNGGETQVKRHEKSEKHMKFIKEREGNTSLVKKVTRLLLLNPQLKFPHNKLS